MRKKYDLGFLQLSTLDAGYLVPIGLLEVLPGDLIRGSAKSFLRAQPLLRPLMHSVNFEIRSFFVPNRLIWTGWETFRNEEGGSLPSFTSGSSEPLLDALGGIAEPGQILSELPIRAYNFIVNDRYYSRHQFLTDRVEGDRTLAKALWANDYFTGARSEPQLGSEETIPLNITGQAPVSGIGIQGGFTPGSAPVNETGGGSQTYTSYKTNAVFNEDPLHPGYPGFYADLDSIATASGMKITDLEKAIASQRFSELRNRLGDEYIDWLRAIGVRPEDTRLRRAEYLGGGKRTIAFGEVLSLSATTDADLGEMAGQGASMLSHKPWTYAATEDGYIVTLASVVPKPVYADAQSKAFLRLQETDFWSPRREGIGDQVILNKEVMASHGTPEGVFGYTDRNRDYMNNFDRVTGEFRNGIEYPAWHWARMFASDPALNASFVQADPSNRVFGSSVDAQFMLQTAHMISARRNVKS